MTTNDLRDTTRSSGFRYVVKCEEHGARANRATTFQARVGWDGSIPQNRGPRRATSEEAAADAVGFLTGASMATVKMRESYVKPEYDVTDPTTGQKIKPKGEPIKRYKPADGPTACYLVAFVNTAGHPTRPNIVERVKPGTTLTKNRSTYGNTLGFSVKECIPPEIHPNRAEAEARAETFELALEADNMFVRVADEAYAPRFSMEYEALVEWVEQAIEHA